jgi:hypothetical protein
MADTPATATPTPQGAVQPEQDPKPQAAGEVIDATGAKPAEAKPTEPPPPPRTYKRKVNGQDEEIPAEAIDAAAKALGLNPNELLSVSQLKRAAYERFREAEKVQKQYEKFKDMDPWQLARELKGLDDGALDKAAEDRLIAKLQRDAMPPEQRALAEQQEKLAKERAEFEKERAAQQEQVVSQQSQAIRAQLEPKVIAAVEAAGLPKTPDAVRAVVGELERQVKYGLPMDVEAAANEVRDQFFRPSLGMLKNMSPAQIVAEIGKEKFDELLRFSIEQQKGAPPPPQAPVETKPKAPEKNWMSPQEWRAKYG